MTDGQTQQQDPWLQDQLKAHVGHLYKNGLLSGHVRAEAAWVLPGRIALSRVGSNQDGSFAFWAISGDVSTDHIERRLAEDPRAAVRHFALRWQLQAARLAEREEGQEDLSELAQKFGREAERLYALTEDDRHWAE